MDSENNIYQAPKSDVQENVPAQEVAHSKLGIASFMISFISGLLTIVVLGYAGYLEVTTPGGVSDNSSVAIIVGLSLFAILGLQVISFGLGIAGVFQKNKKKVFAILGICFSGFTIASIVGLIA